MRTAIRNLAAPAILGLALAACSSGITVLRPVPAPAPVVYVEPLEVDIARPHKGKLFVQTSRAAYVAIFEIVPDRGVELVYPVSPRHGRFVVAGLRDVPTWWESSRVTYHAGWSTSRAYPGRYIYALASDEPLRIPDAAYRPGYLRDVLGSRVYWSANPYLTMRALAREFVPSVRDEEWAEDMYVLSPSYATDRYRVTRVYCRGGAVYEVPWEFADRVWCPTYVRGGSNERGRVTEVDMPGNRRPLVRPDSVVGDNGRRVATRARGSNGRGPIDRVKEPAGPDHRGNDPAENEDDRPGNGPAKQRPGVGPRDIPRVVPNERTDDPPPPRGRGREVVEVVDDRGAAKPNANGESKPDPRSESKPDPRTESKPDAKSESKPDAKSESKPDSSGGAKPETSGETTAEPKKGRGRPEAKDEKPADGKSKQRREPKP